MKVKLFEIYSSVPVMNKILEATLPATVSFQLTKLLKTLNEEIKIIEEQRVKLVTKYGENGENEAVTVSDSKKEEFLKEFSELLESEIELNWQPLSISNFDGLNLSVNDMLKVQFLFTDWYIFKN